MAYEKLTLSGTMLQSCFSIYLIEIKKPHHKKYIYIGMTGDNVYPSARSAFYRLAGHLEKASRSTQNRIYKALATEDFELFIKNAEIVMHHFAVEGFKKWTVTENMKWKNLKKVNFQSLNEYKEYKAVQEKVLAFENYLISKYSNVKEVELLNKTNNKASAYENSNYQNIEKGIDDIVKQLD
jgi:hypothetical protein